MMKPFYSQASLQSDAARTGRYFGCAASTDQLAQDRLVSLVLSQCAIVTPEYQLKWDALEYAPDQFYFDHVDAMLNFTARTGIALRGHTLLWETSTPAWVKQQMLSSRDWGIVSRYFSKVLGRYGPYIREWDVVNEPIDTLSGAGGLRTNTFFRAYGPEYIERALRQARALAPHAQLMINDYSFEYANAVDEARRDAFLALLRSLKAAGAPLDGIGLQAHLDLSKGSFPEARLREFYKEIADLGLFIIITEMDVKEQDMAQPTGRRDAEVADETLRFLAIALSEPAVRGVITWGLTDRYSWLSPSGTRGESLNRGLPYDAVLAKTPMYSAIGSAFELAR